MRNPAYVLPDTMQGIQLLMKSMGQGGVPEQTMALVGLRASQINGGGACVHVEAIGAREAGVSDERLLALPAWRETPFFTDAERAALALVEAATRLADRPGDAVSDELWEEFAAHYDERQRAALILYIATGAFFNTINATIKEQAGTTWT
ncbi:carboxymuconolactone decarboxylase family protein [Nonomuraea africana]|uniref:AhpD family alkylhydroperoxidase n=1 Tax=Nonomuraea africana TaxID=46171 RepID=A0ABR9KC52_9ACTN|nr:carboxymuconolactone decarboxylase family protein [Nonomuraea africana]MBE1559584.1 AhpD family alkylhydroperoxidase [Nonomuraea africana]